MLDFIAGHLHGQDNHAAAASVTIPAAAARHGDDFAAAARFGSDVRKALTEATR